ncbi:MAG: hypothetical protein JNL87_11695 [Burkholderiaceae bacterium]|nr:hypothetical protein [Burkholderiaceae bacterium]
MADMTCRFILATALLAATVQSVRAQEVLLFGKFHLGGKAWFSKVCPRSSAETSVKDVCWLGELPRNYSGQRAGTILVPKEDLPAWAEFSSFELWFQGEALQRVKLTVHAQDQMKIVSSISERFGKPIEVSLSDYSARWVTWERPDVSVKYVCGGDSCSVYFISAEMRTRQAEDLAVRNRRDVARPRTP